MLGPSLGEGLPASHLGVPTTLRAENGHQRRGLCHGQTPSRLCLDGGAVSNSAAIRRVFHPWWGIILPFEVVLLVKCDGFVRALARRDYHMQPPGPAVHQIGRAH